MNLPNDVRDHGIDNQFLCRFPTHTPFGLHLCQTLSKSNLRTVITSHHIRDRNPYLLYIRMHTHLLPSQFFVFGARDPALLQKRFSYLTVLQACASTLRHTQFIIPIAINNIVIVSEEGSNSCCLNPRSVQRSGSYSHLISTDLRTLS